MVLTMTVMIMSIVTIPTAAGIQPVRSVSRRAKARPVPTILTTTVMERPIARMPDVRATVPARRVKGGPVPTVLTTTWIALSTAMIQTVNGIKPAGKSAGPN
jgi:hypothetical protein